MEQYNFQNIDFDSLKSVIAQNLVKFRKNAGLTQQELADKLNYSDKAVSKWERADGIPDVLVLCKLAQIYDVTVNDFLVEQTEVPTLKSLRKNLVAKRWLTTLLSASLAYLVATIIMVVWLFVDKTVPVAKYAYLTAAPVSLIVLLVFSCLWGHGVHKCLAASGLIWSLCALIDVCLVVENSWLIYIVGATLQLMVILWFLLRYFVHRDRARKEKARKQRESE